MKIKTYKAETKWEKGTVLETKVREFSIRMDEPLELKGTNTAPSPVELLLAAAGGCIALTCRGYARKFRMEIEKMTVSFEGDLVRGGWIDTEDRERRGFKEIRFEVKIKTKAPSDKVRELLELVEKKCPISDMLSNPTEIKWDVTLI